MGEAAKNVPDSLRARYPAVPWKEMAGMRDKVIHFYFGVDCQLVWLAVKECIPAVESAIRQILREIDAPAQ